MFRRRSYSIGRILLEPQVLPRLPGPVFTASRGRAGLAVLYLVLATGALADDQAHQEKPAASPGALLLKATYAHDAMGTQFEFTVYVRPGDTGTDEIEHICQEAFDAVDDLENRISVWRPNSQVTYINHHAAETPVQAAPDVLDLVLFSRRMYRETGGAFDVTVGPLVELWGFSKEAKAKKEKGEERENLTERALPSDTALAAALQQVGMDGVRVDRTARSVSFARAGMRLDFGGIGKGLALDRAAEILTRHGVTAAALNAGTSSVVAIGSPPNEAGWKIRIRDPYNKTGYVDEVLLRDESLSTSGSYEKFFEVKGRKYCHIFDPHTGKPVEGMLSATAIGSTGIQTDALSTAFFVMGPGKTEAYCRAHPEVRAILVPVPDSGGPRSQRIGFRPEKESP